MFFTSFLANKIEIVGGAEKILTAIGYSGSFCGQFRHLHSGSVAEPILDHHVCPVFLSVDFHNFHKLTHVDVFLTNHQFFRKHVRFLSSDFPAEQQTGQRASGDFPFACIIRPVIINVADKTTTAV